MTRPEDIPEDVWDAANAINDILTPNGVAKIARAILAERERCAGVAEDHARAWGLAMGTGATEIAIAIRKGTRP